MANIEHIKLLCQGVKTWNDHRNKHDFTPDLTHVEIRNTNLKNALFQQTDFDGSIFSNVDFGGARMEKARLNGVTVSRTSFRLASLTSVELKGADFKRACFEGTDLSGAIAFDLKIRHANLINAKFNEATLRYNHIYNSDVRGINLQDAELEHVILKRATIEQSRIADLKHLGCGIELENISTPSEWTDWDNFDVRQGEDEFGVIIHKGRAYWISEGRWDFFISHTGADKEHIARPLAEALRERGQRVWYDEFEVRPGDSLAQVIDFGTRASVFGVIVVSKDFFGRKWTEAELDALSKKRLFLLLHELTPEDLQQLRPDLEDRVSISTSAGIDKIADALVDAAQQLPQHG